MRRFLPNSFRFAARFAAITFLILLSDAVAQTITATQNGKVTSTTLDASLSGVKTVPASEQAVPPPALVPPAPAPLIDPSKELKGLAVLAAIRKGGYNLYMRHGAALDGHDAATLAQMPKWWETCTLQRNLSATGREQARKVGAALRQLNVPIESVKAGQFCRTRDTAHAMKLGSGAVEITEDLNHQMGQRVGFDVGAARFAQLAVAPPAGTNVLMISHTHGSSRAAERVMVQIQEAEIVMYLPDGHGGAEPVARIAAADWDALIALAETQ